MPLVCRQRCLTAQYRRVDISSPWHATLVLQEDAMVTRHSPDSQPLANLGGRPLALKPKHLAALHDIVAERVQASLQEIAN